MDLEPRQEVGKGQASFEDGGEGEFVGGDGACSHAEECFESVEGEGVAGVG